MFVFSEPATVTKLSKLSKQNNFPQIFSKNRLIQDYQKALDTKRCFSRIDKLDLKPTLFSAKARRQLREHREAKSAAMEKRKPK